MGVAFLGPIAVSFHGDPAFTFTGDATANGMQPASISGVLEWDQGKQLKELVDNPDRRRNPSGIPGVLEPIWTDDTLLADFNGVYVLQNCQLSPSQVNSLGGGLVPFTLTATRVPDEVAVVATRSARARANDYGLAAVPLVTAPFHDDDIDGSPFTVNPGGSRFTRVYDASHPHDTAALTPAADDARAMTLYANPTAGVVYPQLTDSPGIPLWVSRRGGDCRLHDRTAMRDVYGPGHPFGATSDCQVTNGLVRAWVGSRLLPGYLHVEAFDGTTWRELGSVLFGSARLLRARIAKVTPDVAILKLTLERKGDVIVTLQRGETKFNLDLPAGVTPAWSGVPPTSRANVARNEAGKFGNGLDAGFDTGDSTWAAPFATWAGDDDHAWDGSPYQADIRLLWPPDAAPTAFSRAFWFRPELAVAALGTAGLLSLYDADGVARCEVYIDGADHKVKVRVNDVVKLTSAALTFTAGSDLLFGLRCSSAGLVVSIRDHLGAIAHLTDATVTGLGVDVLYDAAYFVNFARWGDGSWGDGVWGGVTYYPGGVVDNDMIWRRAITDAEFVLLAAATGPHAALPQPVGDCIWYAPYDAAPLPALSADAAGLSTDPTTDAHGFTKAIAYLDAARTKAAAVLARASTYDTAAAQHKQLASASEQSVRVA